MLTTLEQQTITAAIRNGLGLTAACRGIHKHPRDISAFIKENEAFRSLCDEASINGYQLILVALNNEANKKSWAKWGDTKDRIDKFVSDLILWETLGTPDQCTFDNIVVAIRRCKTLAETASAFGMTETDLIKLIYQDNKLVTWLIQNGYQI